MDFVGLFSLGTVAGFCTSAVLSMLGYGIRSVLNIVR